MEEGHIMQYGIRIPPALHAAIPEGHSVSGLIRQLLSNAIEDPGAVLAAFSTLPQVDVDKTTPQRYALYLPDVEQAKASALAEKYRLSLNQLIQIMLEDLLFRAGRWPIEMNMSESQGTTEAADGQSLLTEGLAK
jgi:hypothetical protein